MVKANGRAKFSRHDMQYSHEGHTSGPKITPELYADTHKPLIQRLTSVPMLT